MPKWVVRYGDWNDGGDWDLDPIEAPTPEAAWRKWLDEHPAHGGDLEHLSDFLWKDGELFSYRTPEYKAALAP